MRSRLTRIVVTLGLAVAICVGLEPGAQATGCTADGAADMTVPGDRSMSADAECTGPVGPDASLNVDVVRDEEGYRVTVRHAVDRDSDGENETSDGQGWVDVECPPPEERGVVEAVVCAF